MTILAHRILLQPRPRQGARLIEQAGYQRWCHNQMLARFRQGLANGIWWDVNTLQRELRRQRPEWTAERWSNGINEAARDLDRAISAWTSRANPARFPRFHRKRDRLSCSFSNAGVRADGRRVRIPKLGWVRMREPLRLDGKLCRATVVREAGRWWVSLVVDTRTTPEPRCGDHVVGVDVGPRSLAVTSDGAVYENPRPLAVTLNDLRKLNRAISRSVKCHGRVPSNRRGRVCRDPERQRHVEEPQTREGGVRRRDLRTAGRDRLAVPQARRPAGQGRPVGAQHKDMLGLRERHRRDDTRSAMVSL